MSGDVLNIPESLRTDGDALAAEIATRWVRMYQASVTRRTEIQESRNYLYATSTETTSNSQSGFDHTTHRPKLTQIYDTLSAIYLDALIPQDRFMSFDPESVEAADKKKKETIVSYLVTKHRQNGFRKTMELLLSDWFGDTGSCVCGVEYVNETFVDENGITQTKYKGPRPFRVDPMDIEINPTSKSWQATPKFQRIFTDFGTLEKDAQAHGEESVFREVLKRVKQERADLIQYKNSGSDTVGGSIEEFEKFRNMYDTGYGSFTEYMESGSVELIIVHADIFEPKTGELLTSQEITVIDRRWVLDMKPVDTWSGQPHLYFSTWRSRPNNLWGMSALDNIVGLQFRIDHLENTRATRFDDLAFPDLVMTADVQIEYQPDGTKVYRIAEGGSVNVLNQDTTVLGADLQIQETERSMEEYAGVPSEAAGFRSPGEKTKFEVSELLTAGTRLFINKLAKFEQEIAEPIMAAELELARRNLGDGQDVIRITGEDGVVTFETINKDDLTLAGTITPLGSRHFKKRAILLQEISQVLQMLNLDEDVKQHFSSVRLAAILDELLEQPGLVSPYVRITEEVEKVRRQQAGQSTIEAESEGIQDGLEEAEEGIPDA